MEVITMGMEALSSISTMQNQSVSNAVPTTKVSSETTDGNTAGSVTVPKVDNETIAVSEKLWIDTIFISNNLSENLTGKFIRI